jgi:diguanylate cyclase (GGDEF)-like protein/PAS domain S-box-containing protein
MYLKTQQIPRRYWQVCWIGLFGILIGVLGSYLTIESFWLKFFDNFQWTATTLAAAVCTGFSYKEAISKQQRLVKIWFLLGFGGYALGQLIWDVQVFADYNEFPSPSDVFYLFLGPCLVLGLMAEIYTHKTSQATKKIILLDVLSLSIASLTLVLILYLPQRGELDNISLSIVIAYPVSLLVVVNLFLIMIPTLRLALSPHLLWFLFGFIVTALSWMRWNLLALIGLTVDGDILNATFSIGILVSGMTCSTLTLHKSESLKFDKWCENFLRLMPLVNVLLASTAVIFVFGNHSALNSEQNLTIGSSLFVIVTAMIRQGLLLNEREQLLLTQSFLRTVIDAVPQRIFWKDTDCRYLGCNNLFANDAGVKTPEALIGENDYALNWSEQAELYQADDKAVMAKKESKLNYEEPQMTPDGNMMWLRTSKIPLQNSEGKVIGVLGIYEDITELKDYYDKLNLMKSMFEHTQENIIITNSKKELIDVNNAFTKITGYERREVLGKNPSFLKSGYQSDEFYKTMWRSIDDTGHWSGEMWNQKKDGEVYPTFTTISAIINENGQPSHYVGIASDITALKKHEKQLERIAHYDALTGVPNRVLLSDRMKQAIAQTKRDKKLLAICYLDLDGFKPINDNFGHHTGDNVLIQITKRIIPVIRESDTLARLGGDEFVILLLGLESVEECIHCLERLLSEIAKPIVIDNLTVSVTTSIGLTIYPIDDKDPDTLLRHADQAMYTAKQSGKNRYHYYDSYFDEQSLIEQQFLNEISEGLKNQQFELYYQPKVSMIDNSVVGVEALIRWNHPQKGFLPPALFLPAIENTTLEIELGDWVINQALFQSQQWLESGHFIPVSVNVAGQQLLESDFIDKLTAVFEKYPNVPNTLLELEILETAALEIDRSFAVIELAKSKLGLTFALDDFGTGYSTLSYLKQLPASVLKIDQSFVLGMLEDNGDKAIVEGVIALAKVFNMKTVAEGVETEKHFQELKKINCEIAQGYGIAKPMSEINFMKWYKQQTRV